MANVIDLASYVAKVEVDDSGLKSGLSQADNMIKGVLDGAGLKTKLTMAGIAVAIGATLKKSVDSFVEFENQMNSVYTLLPDISESAMAQMEDQVRSLSKEMGVLPDELIPALYSSLSASVPQDNVFQFLEVAQKGAIAGMTETETVVDGLTTVLNSYHMEATEAEKVSDILFNTIKYGKTSMEELSGSMSQVTPIASSLGVDFEDVGAALATMTAQGNSTSASTTQLKQMFSELSKEGTKTSDVFKQIAGKSFKEFIAEGNNVNDALQLLENYANETGVGVNDLFGSVQAGQAALMLTGKSAEMFSQNIDRMGDSAGATEQAYQTMDNGIGRSFEKIKVAMNDMLLELGTNLAPAVASMADYIIEIMPYISKLIEITFKGIGYAIKGLIEVIGWMVKGIEMAVKGVIYAFTHMKEMITTILDGIKTIISTFSNTVKNIWEIGFNVIKSITENIWTAIKNIFSTVLNAIKNIVTTITNGIKSIWSGSGEEIKSNTQSNWNGIKDIITNMLNAIKTVILSILDNIKSIWSSGWNSIKDTLSNIWNNMLNIVERIGERIKDVTNKVIDGANRGIEKIKEWNAMKPVVHVFETINRTVNEVVDKVKTKVTGKTKTTGKTPSYDVGTPFVPNDQLAFIHKGEAVIPAKYNPNNPANKGGATTGTPSEITENHYHISKLEFPNVHDAREIESAISNLSNYATQWAHKIGR